MIDVQPLSVEMRRQQGGRQLWALHERVVEAPVLLDRDQLDPRVGGAAGLQNHLQQ